MKLKPFVQVRPGKISFGTTLEDNTSRGDMFLPSWVLILGILLILFGSIFIVVFSLLHLSAMGFLLAAVLLLLGAAAILCWKNQIIRMLSDETFEYSTFWGKKTICRFCDIRGIKKNPDSVILLLVSRKVYIDSAAIISDRLADRIDRRLNELYGDGLTLD